MPDRGNGEANGVLEPGVGFGRRAGVEPFHNVHELGEKGMCAVDRQRLRQIGPNLSHGPSNRRERRFEELLAEHVRRKTALDGFASHEAHQTLRCVAILVRGQERATEDAKRLFGSSRGQCGCLRRRREHRFAQVRGAAREHLGVEPFL